MGGAGYRPPGGSPGESGRSCGRTGRRKQIKWLELSEWLKLFLMMLLQRTLHKCTDDESNVQDETEQLFQLIIISCKKDT
ncbi:hypothetical protein AMQ84_15580 [Paenibacillus riograndensis]|uniref:Uncharacterized protein n=1 Tax=Paenibacillus riograndensis TaxID=483937 RepID=A0A132TYJ1_9BACL|nr:hypothetical protein AMQ84_15580 [Paenibacillus riograndensis]